jgi:hypothetical protein
MPRSALVCLLAFIAVVSQGCGSKAPLAPKSTSDGRWARGSAADETLAPRRQGSTVGAASQIEGEIGPGARYAIHRPEAWNGSLVLYVHGYVAPGQPVALPTGEVAGLRDFLLAQGFAVGDDAARSDADPVLER